MRISCSNRFILLHVPRTGVSSIIAALDDGLFVRARPTATNKLFSKALPFIPRPIAKRYLRVHETAAQARRLIGAEVFDEYCKIAFVRNPFSWLVSLYELVLQSPNHRHYRQLAALGSFAAYVDWEIRRNKRHQYPYLLDRDGRLLVDRLGRFERLAEDTQQIFESIAVAIEPLPCVGRFTRQDYREFYDGATRRRVEDHWQRDLEVFGYDFDGLVDPAAPIALQASSGG